MSRRSIPVVLALALIGTSVAPGALADELPPDEPRISGTVSSAIDAPLDEVVLWIYEYDETTGNSWGVEALWVGEDGSFSSSPLPAGVYYLEFTDWSGVHQWEYWSGKGLQTEADLISHDGETPTSGLNATLTPAAHIIGVVTDGENGLEGRSLLLIDESGHNVATFSGPEGHFDLGGLRSGSYRLQVTDSSGIYAPTYYGGTTWDTATQIPVTAPDTVDIGTIELQLAGGISGTVTDGTDPISGVWVTASGDLGWVSSTQTEPDGTYTIPSLPPDEYEVTAQHSLGEFNGASVGPVPVLAGEVTTNVDLVLAPIVPGFTGRVTDSEDNALFNAYVSVLRWNEEWSTWEYVADSWTDGDGYYATASVPSGAYTLVFSDPLGTNQRQWWDGKASQLDADTIFHDGITTSVHDAELYPGGTISGVVTDPEGNGLEGITLQLTDEMGDGFGHSSGPGGVFDLAGLSSGSYRLQFWDDSGAHAPGWYGGLSWDTATQIPVSAPATVDIGTIQLQLAGGISGTVTDGEGNPFTAGAWVTAYNSDLGWNSSQTQGDGTFTILGLAPGDYEVYGMDFSGTFIAPSVGPVPVVAGEVTPNVTLVMEPFVPVGPDPDLPNAISGVVTNAGGASLEGIEVWAYRGFNDFAGESTSQLDGSFTISGLESGDYRLVLNDPSGFHYAQWYDGLEYVPRFFDNGDFSAATAVTVTDGEVTTVTPVMQIAGWISGTITNTLGEPIPDVVVYAYDTATDTTSPPRASSTTDDSGIYELGGLAPGEYYVRAGGDNTGTYLGQWHGGDGTSEQADSVTVGVGYDFATVVDFELKRYSRITGTVSDGEGNALAGIWVDAYDLELNLVDTGGSGPEGDFHIIMQLGPGPHLIRAYDTSGEFAAQWLDEPVVAVEDGDTSIAITMNAALASAEVQAPDGVIVYFTSVVISESDPGDPPEGYTLFDWWVDLTIFSDPSTPATAENPFVIVFSIDHSAIPGGTTTEEVVVFRNGDPVAGCDISSPTVIAGGADPDPCVASRIDTGAEFEITVRTSEASAWTFGAPLSEPEPLFDFSGFFPPVGGTDVWATAKAGQAIPIKFSLGGDQGLDILAADSPSLTEVACLGGSQVGDDVAAAAVGKSGLTYDDGQYTYVLKTSKAMANMCYRFDLELVDGSTHSFFVHFKG